MTYSYYLLILSTFTLLFLITNKLIIDKYKIVYNPYVLLCVLFVLYFCLPALFTSEISYYYKWNISNDSIFYSNITVSLVGLVISLTLFFDDKVKINQSECKSNKYIFYIWWLIFSYTIFVITYKYINGSLFVNGSYIDNVDRFKIKNVAYILVSVSVICVVAKNNVFYFLPNILVAMIDMLQGSRTTALIVLLPIILYFILKNRKLYFSYLVVVFSVMIIVGVTRSDNQLISGIPFYITAMGEFRETFITLPYYILNHNFISHGSLTTFLSSFSLNLLWPIRELIVANSDFAGMFAANDINRGYGLASNFIMDSLYYGYFMLPITICFFIILCSLFTKFINNNKLHIVIIFTTFFILFLRLSIREGVYIYLGSYTFLILVYVLPIILLNSIKVKH